MEDEVFLYSK